MPICAPPLGGRLALQSALAWSAKASAERTERFRIVIDTQNL
jgi:hypothetical protein